VEDVTSVTGDVTFTSVTCYITFVNTVCDKYVFFNFETKPDPTRQHTVNYCTAH